MAENTLYSRSPLQVGDGPAVETSYLLSFASIDAVVSLHSPVAVRWQPGRRSVPVS